MFEYSKTALKKVVNDIKKLVYVCDVVVQSLMIFYLIYAIVTQAGKLWANIPLLTICAAYFLYFLITTKADPLYKQDATQKKLRKAVKYSKLCIKFCSLGVTLYGIYVATTHVTALSVILAATSLVGWILQVVFEIIKILAENLYDLAKEAVKADVEEIMKPVATVKNFFKNRSKEETDDLKPKSKRRLWLDEKVAQLRTQRLEEKKAKKQARKEKKKLHSRTQTSVETQLEKKDKPKKNGNA